MISANKSIYKWNGNTFITYFKKNSIY